MLQKERSCLLVIYSYHHNNTEKVAQAMAKVLKADIKRPEELSKDDLSTYDLIGFGAGIDSGKHYKELLMCVDTLEVADNKPSFIFSTSAVQGTDKVYKDHTSLRVKLNQKGFTILDEFSCKGFNTNSFLKFFGGMNKGRPNEEDLEKASEFALDILKKAQNANN